MTAPATPKTKGMLLIEAIQSLTWSLDLSDPKAIGPKGIPERVTK